ncbi:hypothetical protein [Bdellovibrio sp. HCB337]|uniref:hypothetical protein n=1 Tax=Bdellovibrio sp. HCB337 TaxID=3394358 RepID=UPI0039A40223
MQSKWLRSPSWDSLWILSGLWLFPLGAILYYSPWSNSFLTYLLIAGPLVGGFHSFMPLLAVFSSESFVEKIKPQRKQIVMMSVLIVVVSMLLGVLGSAFARPEFWLLAGYVYLLWNTWHFSAQNFGVLSLYRSAQGQSDVQDRKIDKNFCLIMGCVIQPIIWFCIEARWGPFIRWIPSWIPTAVLTKATLTLAALLTAAYVVWEFRKKNPSYQKIAYALSLGIQPFAGVFAYYPFHFLVYSIPHWVVEIGITGSIQTNDAKKSKQPVFFAKMLGLILVCLALVYFLEPPGDRDANIFEWWEWLAFNEMSTESVLVQWTLPTLISFLAVSRSFLHFYLSRQIYKSTRWTLGKINANP